MTNSELLYKEMKEARISMQSFADIIGISEEDLLKKINNELEFKVSEIVIMQYVLELDSQKRDQIFFAPRVE